MAAKCTKLLLKLKMIELWKNGEIIYGIESF